MKKRILVLFLAVTMLFSNAGFAHSGRTDSSGGHKDNKNVSGLGSYHYHHGEGPHLHTDGICPYSVPVSTVSYDLTEVQEKLNDLGYKCGTPDGKLGAKTKTAIKSFQKDNKITADGKLGPKTLEALGF